MRALPNGRDKDAEEQAFLLRCHRTRRNRPDVVSILDRENFFRASHRPTYDAWSELYAQEWQGRHNMIKGAEIMSALRDHLADIQQENCCYCRQPLLRGGYSRQIEHVLPKSVFGRFSFYFWNLAVACERCNRLKHAKGYQPLPNDLADYPEHIAFDQHYHPRFHVYREHIKFAEVADEDHRYVLYVGQTAQGRKLVEDILTDAAREMTRESIDPAVRESMEKIRAEIDGLEEVAIDAIEQFQSALIVAMHATTA